MNSNLRWTKNPVVVGDTVSYYDVNQWQAKGKLTKLVNNNVCFVRWDRSGNEVEEHLPNLISWKPE
jgi:hypothetical protein